MPGVADFEIGRAGHGRIGLDQVRGIEQAAAVVALVAPGGPMATVRTGPFHIAVGQEALVVDRIDHPIGAFFDQAVVFQHVGEVLGQLMVLGRGGPSEPVPGQAEFAAEPVLNGVVLLAVGEHVEARVGGGQLGRRAVLVGGADVEHIVTLGPLEARIDVRRQHRTRQIAQVLDAVDVRQGRCDQDAGHGGPSLEEGRAERRGRNIGWPGPAQQQRRPRAVHLAATLSVVFKSMASAGR